MLVGSAKDDPKDTPYLYLNLTLLIVFDVLSDNLLYWMIQSNWMKMQTRYFWLMGVLKME